MTKLSQTAYYNNQSGPLTESTGHAKGFIYFYK